MYSLLHNRVYCDVICTFLKTHMMSWCHAIKHWAIYQEIEYTQNFPNPVWIYGRICLSNSPSYNDPSCPYRNQLCDVHSEQKDQWKCTGLLIQYSLVWVLRITRRIIQIYISEEDLYPFLSRALEDVFTGDGWRVRVWVARRHERAILALSAHIFCDAVCDWKHTRKGKDCYIYVQRLIVAFTMFTEQV